MNLQAHDSLPVWAREILRSPGGDPVSIEGDRLIGRGTEVGKIESGIVRILVDDPDPSITYYRAIGGAHFYERASVPFAMSALDTPLYHRFLDEIAPSPGGIVVDVGGGDGRNAYPWLERGYRVVVVDAAGDALLRFRNRLASEAPEYLSHTLLIEADARALPLADGCADALCTIETLYYLNEDYELGLSECVRAMGSEARILISERNYEGALLTELLYQGVQTMLGSVGTRAIWDGVAGSLVRTRCFTASELGDLVRAHSLETISKHGTPILSLVLGWLQGKGLIPEDDRRHLSAVEDLIRTLGYDGNANRCNVIIARRVQEH
jgi:SAM-dependent methyltransferase